MKKIEELTGKYQREKERDIQHNNDICGNICFRYKTMSLIHGWATLPYKISTCNEFMSLVSKENATVVVWILRQ